MIATTRGSVFSLSHSIEFARYESISSGTLGSFHGGRNSLANDASGSDRILIAISFSIFSDLPSSLMAFSALQLQAWMKAALSFLQLCVQVFYRRIENFITSFPNSFGRRLDFDVWLNADALQLAAIGVTHIVTGEVDINPAGQDQVR